MEKSGPQKVLDDSWVLLEPQSSTALEEDWEMLEEDEHIPLELLVPLNDVVGPLCASTKAVSKGPSHKRPQRGSNNLFTLKKVLSIHSEANAAASLSQRAPTSAKHKPLRGTPTLGSPEGEVVNIDLVAHGAIEGHSFVALYLSNDFFVFRYVSDDGLPIIRQFPWYRDMTRKIRAMDFDPNAQWLVCVTADVSVVLIPIYYLLAHARPEGISSPYKSGSFESELSDIDSMWATAKVDSWFSFDKGSRDAKRKEKEEERAKLQRKFDASSDVTVIRDTVHPNSSQVTACKWWRTWNGQDILIIASFSGSVRFLDLRSHEVARVKCKQPIIKMDLIIDPNKSFKYLLLHSHSGGYWKLVIELRSAFTSFDTIMKPPPSSAATFTPTPLTPFSKPNTKLSKQVSRGAPYIGALNAEAQKIELFDINLGKFPVYTYQLAAGGKSAPVRVAHVTDKIIFTIAKVEDKFAISAISRRQSAFENNVKPRRALQQFLFPANQKPLGYFRNGLSDHYLPTQKPSFSLERSHAVSESLEGLFIWTADSLFEIEADIPPEQLFFELIARGADRDAEDVGKAFDLDVLQLYELAADEYFEQAQHGRALDVAAEKVVGKFVSIGRVDVAITRLRSLLHNPDRLSSDERKKIADLLFSCYLQRVLASPSDSSALEVFESFITSNGDYDAAAGIELAIKADFVDVIFTIAHARNMVERALGSFISSKSSLRLSAHLIGQLAKYNRAREIRSAVNGAVGHITAADTQLELLLKELVQGESAVDLNDLVELLPFASDEALNALLCAFDPKNAAFAQFVSRSQRRRSRLSSAASLNQAQIEAASFVLGSDSFVEVFVIALLHLAHRSRSASAATQPAASTFDSASPLISSADSAPSLRTSEDSATAPPSRLCITGIVCGLHHVLCTSSNGDVFAWGRNACGQLGDGSTHDRANVVHVSSLGGHSIRCVAAGAEHSVCTDGTGFTWAWGSGAHGQLGLANTASHETPQRILTLDGERIIQLACGRHFTAARTDKELYIWGNISNMINSVVPFKIPHNLKIEHMACGDHHLAVLTASGEVWTLGLGTQGQLGHGSKASRDRLGLVDSLASKNIRALDCGAHHTAAVTDLYNVYVWGDGDGTPRMVSGLRGHNVTQIACGATHTVAITESGEVFAWENSSDISPPSSPFSVPADLSLSGASSDSSSSASFRRVATTRVFRGSQDLDVAGKNVRAICCGDNFTVALSGGGNVYTWGDAAFGQLGHGSAVGNLPSPQRIPPTVFHALVERAKPAPQTHERTASATDPGPATPVGETAVGRLQIALLEHRGQYNGARLAHIASTLRDWSLLAIVSYSAQLWESYVEATLLCLTGMPKDALSSKLLATLDALIEGPLKRKVGGVDGLLIYRVFEAWKEHDLPAETLQKHLEANMRQFEPHLSLLIEQNASDPPLAVEFDRGFLLSIAQSSLREPDDQPTRLLASILSNLSTSTLRVGDRSTTLKGPAPKVVSFTCGHRIVQPYLVNTLVPQLQEKLMQLSDHLILTSKLIVMEYHQKEMNLACPLCVYNELLTDPTFGPLQCSETEKWDI